MKQIYKFTLNKEAEIDDVQISQNEKNEEVRTIVKVKKQEPHTYFIRKPNRVLVDEGELYFASQISLCEKRGILRANLVQKRYMQDGGVLTDEQAKEYNNAYERLFNLQAEQSKLNEIKDKTSEQEEQFKKVIEEMVEIYTIIQNFNSKMDNQLYQHTAENIARNKTAFWWTLMLSHEEKDGKFIPVFGQGEFEDKLIKYDELEEGEDKFTQELIQKLLLVASLWYFGKAETQEDFDLAIKLHEKQNLVEAIETLGKGENKGFIPNIPGPKGQEELNKTVENSEPKLEIVK